MPDFWSNDSLTHSWINSSIFGLAAIRVACGGPALLGRLAPNEMARFLGSLEFDKGIS